MLWIVQATVDNKLHRLDNRVQRALNKHNAVCGTREELPILRELHASTGISLDLANGETSLANNCSGRLIWDQQLKRATTYAA